MIRTSKHNISNITNQVKLDWLNTMFTDFASDLKIYINYILDGTYPLKKQLSSKLLLSENITHSRYKQLIYMKASEIIRSQIKIANKRRYKTFKKVYSYMKDKHPDSDFVKLRFKELNLTDIIHTRYFTIPNVKNLSINLDERFFDIKCDETSFDKFINIKLPYFNERGTRALKINIPIKMHKHANKLSRIGYTLKKNVQIKKVRDKYYVNLVWEKVKTPIKKSGVIIGLDSGYKKLLADSRGYIHNGDILNIYELISRKKQGSEAFRRALTYRDNEINRIVNSIDLNNVKTLVIEDLKDVKKGKKYYTNKIQRWSYTKTIEKIELLCMEKGIELVKVSPAYTSQTCSSCGNIDKESRNGENYLCVSCGYEIDADLNASINIRDKGV